MTSIRQKSVFLLILALAAGLQIWAVAIPTDENTNEENIITRALHMGRDRLSYSNYDYPPLMSFLLFTTYAGRYLAGRGAGAVESPDQFANEYFADPLSFFIQGRAGSSQRS